MVVAKVKVFRLGWWCRGSGGEKIIRSVFLWQHCWLHIGREALTVVATTALPQHCREYDLQLHGWVVVEDVVHTVVTEEKVISVGVVVGIWNSEL